MRNVLIVAAHPDDEILGVGGTVKVLADAGVVVRALILAEGQTSRTEKREDTPLDVIIRLRENAAAAAEIMGFTSIDFCDFPDNRMDGVNLLDIIKVVSQYIEKYSPDTIFTHHHGDLNIDHRRVCEAVLTACRPTGKDAVKRIYAFETPSSTEWNYTYENSFRPNVYVDISGAIEVKAKGMNCYESERTEFPHPRSEGALRALARYRGSNSGMEYAEGFMLLRETVEIRKLRDWHPIGIGGGYKSMG